MQQQHDRATGGARLRIGDSEHAGVDLLQRAERCVGPGLDRDELAGLRLRKADLAERGGGEGQRRGAQKAAAVMVDFCRHGPFSFAFAAEAPLKPEA